MKKNQNFLKKSLVFCISFMMLMSGIIPTLAADKTHVDGQNFLKEAKAKEGKDGTRKRQESGGAVYLDQKKGDDANDGSEDNPVKTIEKAKSIAGVEAKIVLVSEFKVSENLIISKGDKASLTFLRGSKCTDSMFFVENEKTLEIDGIVLDGSASKETGPIISTKNSVWEPEKCATIKIKGNSVLKNNKCGNLDTPAGAIMANGHVDIKDTVFEKNKGNAATFILKKVDAMYNQPINIELENVKFSDNINGGSILALEYPVANFEAKKCTFERNDSQDTLNSTLVVATAGSQSLPIKFTECVIKDNKSKIYGFQKGRRPLSLNGCTIENNLCMNAPIIDTNLGYSVNFGGKSVLKANTNGDISGLDNIFLSSSLTDGSSLIFEQDKSKIRGISGYTVTLNDAKYMSTKSGKTGKYNASGYIEFEESVTPPPVKHTVTFDAKGGSPIPAPVEIEDGQAIGDKLPSGLTKNGYKFKGWSTESDANAVNVNSNYKVKGSVTLYAVWEKNSEKFKVTFDTKGGTPVPPERLIEKNNYVGSLPKDVIKEGYKLKGWSKDPEGVEVNVYDTTSITSNVTFYAVWKKVHTVTFDTKGGNPVPESKKIEDGNQIGNLPAGITKDGYKFKGWSKDPEATTVNAAYNLKITSDMTLYAVWESTSPVKHTVTFDAKGGSPMPAPVEIEDGQAIGDKLPSGLTKNGYKFKGWSTKNEGNIVDVNKDYIIKSAMTLYAVWEKAATPSPSPGPSPGPSPAPTPTPTPTPPISDKPEYKNVPKLKTVRSKNGNIQITFEAKDKKGTFALLKATGKNEEGKLIFKEIKRATFKENSELLFTDKKPKEGILLQYKLAWVDKADKLSDESEAILAVNLKNPKIKVLKNLKKNIVRITWNKSKNIDGYDIYKSDKRTGSYVFFKKVSSKQNFFTDRLIRNKKAVYYNIVAYKKLSKKIWKNTGKIVKVK